MLSRNRYISQNGFSLVEVIVAVGLIGVVLLAGASILPAVFKVQNRITINSGLSQVITSFRGCINDDRSWNLTVADPANASLACLRDTTRPCNRGTYERIRLHRGDVTAGVDLCNDYDPLIPTQGFTREGVLCNTFNATAGNDDCPFRMDFSWTARCPYNQTSCMNPIVEVRGVMTQKTRTPELEQAINLNRYRLQVVRGRGMTETYLHLYESKPQGTPGGNCAGGSYRAFNEESDPGSYADLDPVNRRIILEPATYECEISAPAFMVSNHRVALMNLSTGQPIVLGTSEYSPGLMGMTPTRSVAIGRFTLNTRTAVGVFHFCAATPNEPEAQVQTMGVPTNIGGPEAYGLMTCVVTDNRRTGI